MKQYLACPYLWWGWLGAALGAHIGAAVILVKAYLPLVEVRCCGFGWLESSTISVSANALADAALMGGWLGGAVAIGLSWLSYCRRR